MSDRNMNIKLGAVNPGNNDYDRHQIGIIRGVHFGLRDGRGEPILSFSVNYYPAMGCLQCLIGDDIKTLLTKGYDGKSIWVDDIASLEGKPIVMHCDANYSRIVGLWDYSK